MSTVEATPGVGPARVIAPPATLRSRLRPAVLLALTALLCVWGFGLGANPGSSAFALSGLDEASPTTLTVPGGGTAIAIGVVVALLAGWQLARGFSRRAMPLVTGAALTLALLGFLCWAASGSTVPLLGLLQNAVFAAVPLVLGALAGILCERSGVINVAIEGQMLAGAFAGALAATVLGNLGAGLVAAMLAGGLMGLLLAVFSIRYLVNQVVLGVVLNLLALGLTSFAYTAFMQREQDSYNSPGFFSPVKIPVLGDIPFVGPLLFQTTVIVYAMYVLVVVVDVMLFRSRWGLRTRAVGEHPKAADTVGINVYRVRYVNVVLGGLVAGLGGASLTIGSVGGFSPNITSGKGFIALAAVIFGRWSPRGAVAAALLFAFADALQTLLSFTQTPVQIPSAFLAMLPYLATVFAVAGLVGRVRAPAADGEPYVK